VAESMCNTCRMRFDNRSHMHRKRLTEVSTD
jgi:hypothetical protein